jgi:hypothetical protein
MVDDNDRVCVGRAAFRAIKAQLRADVEAILAFAVADLSLGRRITNFPARALSYDVTRRDTSPFSAPSSQPFRMSPKRAAPSESSSRQNKKRKITTARSISVQRIPGKPSKSNDSNGQY